MDGMTHPLEATADASAVEPQPGSVSFVVTSYEQVERAETNLKFLQSVMRDGDEVIVLTGAEPVAPPSPTSWFRVVTVPHATEFMLRAHIPAVCCKEWVVMLEDHSFVDDRIIAAIRQMLRGGPDADLIVFLAKNLTSVSRWDWAIFLHTFALVWAPLVRPPPFAPVTSVIVRRSALGSEAPMQEGAWELDVIPRIFRTGKIAYSNDIFVDHVRSMTLASAFLIAFHNARAGAALQRVHRIPIRNILYEGWYAFVPRPRELAEALADRRHELPPATFWRLHVIGLAHLIGNFVGSFFGGGRSAFRL